MKYRHVFAFLFVVALSCGVSVKKTGSGDGLATTGGTLTGEVVVDDLGLEFTEGDTLTDCSTFSSTGGGIFYDDSEGKFKKCQDNVLSDLDAGGVPTVTAKGGAGTESPVTVAASDCDGDLLTNGGETSETLVFDLPVATAGMICRFMTTAAFAIRLNPQAGATILGQSRAAGEYVESAAAVGQTMTLIAASATEWGIFGFEGSWVNE